MHPCSSLTCCLSLDYLNLELLLHYQLDPVCAFVFCPPLCLLEACYTIHEGSFLCSLGIFGADTTDDGIH